MKEGGTAMTYHGWTDATQLFVVINERGAMFGPFDSVISAASFADDASGIEHAWRIVRLIRPKKQHTQ